MYQTVHLEEKTLLKLLAAIEVYKIDIEETDYKQLKQGYQYIQEIKFLESNQL